MAEGGQSWSGDGHVVVVVVRVVNAVDVDSSFKLVAVALSAAVMGQTVVESSTVSVVTDVCAIDAGQSGID